MDAVATDPKKKAPKLPKPAFDSREIPIPQPEPFVMPGLNEPLVRPETHIECMTEPLTKDYAEALAFAEEPVTIQIMPGHEKFAQKFQQAWVNGKRAELWLHGQWIEPKGVPVGVPITTKRKYVEVFARSVVDTIRTDVIHPENPEEDVQNRVLHNVSANIVFMILEDRSPKAHAWRRSLLGVS